jgi:hypothetical protein
MATRKPEMTCPRAVEALTKQHDRLVGLLRLIDDGRWWTEDNACLIDEAEICLQADRIGAALDVVERLAAKMAAEDGTGGGSHPVSKEGHSVKVPIHSASEGCAVPVDLGPFSPGPVDPHPDGTKEPGGYEKRSWGLSDGGAKLT